MARVRVRGCGPHSGDRSSSRRSSPSGSSTSSARRGSRADRFDARGGAPRRPRGVRQPRGASRRKPRRQSASRLLDELRADLRYAVRLLRQSPTLHGGGRAVARPRHRRQLGDVQPDGKRALEDAAGPRAGSIAAAHLGVGPGAGHELDVGQPAPDRQLAGRTGGSFSYPAFLAMQRDAERVRSSWSAFKPIGRLTARHRRQGGARGSRPGLGRFLSAIRRASVGGRAILPADDRARSGRPVAVISEAFWARRFGRDPSAIGRTIRVNQVPVTIVGVNPPSFTGLTPAGARSCSCR